MLKPKSKTGIMITLGHNSSALFYDGVNKPIGFEEERLSGIKSDSSFPSLALNAILSKIDTKKLVGGTVFISHWFDVFDDENFPKKYYDREFIAMLVKQYKMKVVFLNEEFTHHDAHAYSAKAFLYDSLDVDLNLGEDTATIGAMYFIVADGFGNNREVVSVYKLQRDNTLKLEERLYGYNMSLGLMYQYATSYCGMKENQDEYKFLGYESSIREVVNEKHIQILEEMSDDVLVRYASNTGGARTRFVNHGSEYLRLEALHETKENLYELFDQVLHEIDAEGILGSYNEEDFLFMKRCIIGYFVQSCVEKIIQFIVEAHDMRNVCLAGGLFYNVKLNNRILKLIEGKICIVPVCGDQGAAIGMYEHKFGKFKFHDLCFGKRTIHYNEMQDEKLLFFKDESTFVNTVVGLINAGKIVNIVAGDMEFGPRALCHTSTLALPTEENVAYINHLNGRNTVMPMAPVILKRNMHAIFRNKEQISRVIGSNRFMIITHDACEEAVNSSKYRGILHAYPDQLTYSGRPQIVYDTKTTIGKILDEVHSLCLINTSFNTHGTPILYNEFDCIDDFMKQSRKDVEDRTYLLFLAND